jgi:hypothetical protein
MGSILKQENAKCNAQSNAKSNTRIEENYTNEDYLHELICC